MRRGTPTIAALSRSLAMLEAVLADREGLSVPAIANAIGLPRATAHRQIATLIDEGFLIRVGGSRLVPGPRLLALFDLVDANQVIVAVAVPALKRLAARLQCLVQLGTFESDMVTYRLKFGPGTDDMFTRVGKQLEAYCTGIGKVLLAHLPMCDREAYLATGPYPALTPHTITDPALLRRELAEVVIQGFARDTEEIAEGLACIAVPIFAPNGQVVAAISASRSTANAIRSTEQILIAALQSTASRISKGVFLESG